jgi:hypothetical protein
MDIIPEELDSGCSFSLAVVVMGISFVRVGNALRAWVSHRVARRQTGNLTGYGFLHGRNRLNVAILRAYVRAYRESQTGFW